MYRKKNEKIIAHLSKDKVLKKAFAEIRQKGKYKLPETGKNLYADLVESIVYQQLSIKAAKTIFERFLILYGGIVPEPKILREGEVEDFRKCGFSYSKAQYAINIAIFFDDHKLTNQSFKKLSDEEIIKLLTQIKGVGVWTVQMVLMSSLGRRNILPTLDLGIQQAIMELYGFEATKKELYQKMEDISLPWYPYRTAASFLLWRWKRIQMGIDY